LALVRSNILCRAVRKRSGGKAATMVVKVRDESGKTRPPLPFRIRCKSIQCKSVLGSK
jgi:hypothetical protein